MAREVVRTVQDGRKQAGLEVSDRIRLHVHGTPLVTQAIDEHREWIMNETLTADWSETAFDTGFSLERDLDDHYWQIALERIGS
jgi:isoleucyl-tRNA synthetase